MSRLLERLFRPFQITMLEPRGGRAVRHFRMNYAGILFIILILTLGSAALTWFYGPEKFPALSSRYAQLQHMNRDIRKKLTETQANLVLGNEQINGLKAELKAIQRQIEPMKRRIRAYESILEARKSSGVHILRARANWKNRHLIAYDIVLVKGGNYPRSVAGSLRITARDGDGHAEKINLGKNTPELPYRMETHTFMRGDFQWYRNWRPDHLLIVRLNQQGKQRDQTEIDIQGGTKYETGTIFHPHELR